MCELIPSKKVDIPALSAVIARLSELDTTLPKSSALYREVHHRSSKTVFWRGTPWKILLLRNKHESPSFKSDYECEEFSWLENIDEEVDSDAQYEDEHDDEQDNFGQTDEEELKRYRNVLKIFETAGLSEITTFVDQMIFNMFKSLLENDTRWLVRVKNDKIMIYE